MQCRWCMPYGDQVPLNSREHVNIQAPPRFTCCPWIQWYCVSEKKIIIFWDIGDIKKYGIGPFCPDPGAKRHTLCRFAPSGMSHCNNVGIPVLVFVKACMLSSMSTNSSDFQVTGCCLVTFVRCYSTGEIRKCFNYDLKRTSIFSHCEKSSNILATIYVCQWVQPLHDFPCICCITTRTLDSVYWGSNNGIWFEFHTYFW